MSRLTAIMPATEFQRYAIYHVPDGPLGDFGASWFGWDCVSQQKATPLARQDWIANASRYGFHATLKAPFRLYDTCDAAQLPRAVEAFAQKRAAVSLGGLSLVWLGRFLALVPATSNDALSDLAAHCVTELDRFRAPLSVDEREKYARRNLSETLHQNLLTWGYPFVMDAFRFHMTLTDRVPQAERTTIEETVRAPLPDVSGPYLMRHISLMGEDRDGRFHQIARYDLPEPPVGSDK
ncbi:DUF1045 domain-containing protein [Marivita hallyeonensis]|uniref:DUF1045 domain-containing protein n=1 Tax=Marivita hallyeonensis TaxID=996342 RepID=UPI0011602594|nr:DUF1045 domain-containing protein [Marivita hallyeonensis]